MSRSRVFCADRQTDRTDHLTPCTCAQGNDQNTIIDPSTSGASISHMAKESKGAIEGINGS